MGSQMRISQIVSDVTFTRAQEQRLMGLRCSIYASCPSPVVANVFPEFDIDKLILTNVPATSNSDHEGGCASQQSFVHPAAGRVQA